MVRDIEVCTLTKHYVGSNPGASSFEKEEKFHNELILVLSICKKYLN